MAEAQFHLGNCYFNANGVSADKSEGVKWWRKAAEQGHVKSQALLGLLHYLGDDVPHDMTEAAKWWRKAAEQGLAYEYECVPEPGADKIKRDGGEMAAERRKLMSLIIKDDLLLVNGLAYRME